MSAQYISTTDFDALAGGSLVRQALYTPAGGSYSNAVFLRAAQFASAKIKGIAKTRGYTLGDSTSDDNVILAAIGQLAIMAWGQRMHAMPGAFVEAANTLKQLLDGDLELGTAPDSEDAIGGAKFSEHDPDTDDNRARVFDNDFMDLY